MNIVILGAGQVGSSVAESLVSEANDITIVDTDYARLHWLQDRLDLRTVTGNAALPSVLAQAGAADAELLIAVTQSDQTNLCACRTAATLFSVPRRIARLRSQDYSHFPQLLDESNFAVDFSICPEQIVTDYIVRLIELPEALQVLELADGVVSLVAVRAFAGSPLVDHPVADIRRHMPDIDARVVAIYRGEQPIIPTGDTRVEADDEVFCLAATQDVRAVMSELRRRDRPTRRILIAGGGNIGFRLAHVRRGDVATVHRLRRGAAESLELVVHGDAASSRVIGRRIEELDLPTGVRVGAMVRENRATGTREVMIAHHDALIEPEDHVILFLVNKALVTKVERLFHVGIGFI